MKVLVLGFGNATGRYNPPSTHCENYISRNMDGHEIITFGYNEGVDIVINPEDEFEKVIERLPKGWNPDLCLLWLLEWNLLPRGIERAPFPTCACIFDWDYDVPYSRACMEAVDLTIVTGDSDKEAVEAIGANRTEAFYFSGAMRDFFNYQPKKIKDRKYDILYTTWIDESVQPGRSDWISRLCSLSDKYKVHIDSHLSYPEYIDLLSDSKLVLSYNRHGSMTVRTTDAGTQGTVVLETGYGLGKYFKPGEDYIPISEDNFSEQIERYLKDEEVLQEMSDRFYKKVTERFEARKRFVELIAFASKKLRGEKIKRKFNSLTKGEKCIRRGELYYYAHFAGEPGVFFLNANSKLLELSIEEFERAVDIEPAPRAMTNLAIARAAFDFAFNKDKLNEDKGREMVALFEKVISTYPSYAMAYFNLGVVHFRLGNLTESLAVFRNALKIFRSRDSHIDPWCLHNRDFDLFNQLIRRNINSNTILLCRGERGKAENHIRDVYCAVMLYLISLMEEKDGYIYKSLDALLESHDLYPDAGLIAKRTARLLNMLGNPEQGLKMYRKAIELCPVDTGMRIEYIQLLYLYQNDKEMMKELKDVLKIMKTVTVAKDDSNKLKNILADFTRFNPDAPYMYDSFNEALLNTWVEILFDYLRKNPEDLTLVLRIIQIWDELGRTDKIIEITEDYISNYLEEISTDKNVRKCFDDIHYYLQGKIEEESRIFSDRYKRLKGLLEHVN